jgi:hypothetical protein
VILVLLTITLLSLVDLFTFRLKPNGHLSGNGNPALLFIILLLPVYLLLLSLVGTASGIFFSQGFMEGKYAIGVICIIVLIGIIQYLLALVYADLIFSSLGGRPSNPISAIKGWNHFNQYTNTAYINLLTYSLGIILSVLLGYFFSLFSHSFRDRLE